MRMEESQEKPAEEVKPKPEEKEVTIVDADADAATLESLKFTKSFIVTWKNPETGAVKVGTFTATRPDVGKLGQIGVLRAKLNGGEKVDYDTDFTHTMMADLHYILTDVPPWWVPSSFFTASPLRYVWDHVVAWLNTFRPKRPS